MAAGDIDVIGAKYNPRKSAVFDGTDDFVAVNTWGTDRQTAADTVGTISGWICTDALTAEYCLLSAGDTDADEFIWFGVVNGLVHLEVSDAATTDLDLEADNITVRPHEWHYIACVQDGVAPKLYCDGKLLAATFDVGTDKTSWFDQMSGIDKADIGIVHANNDTTQDMNGAISDVKHWNIALTADEVKHDYLSGVPEHGSVGGTTGTRGALVTAARVSYWDFDEDFNDSWAGANNGSATGAFLDPQFTNMTSRLRGLTTLVADDIALAVDGGNMYAVRVRAA